MGQRFLLPAEVDLALQEQLQDNAFVAAGSLLRRRDTLLWVLFKVGYSWFVHTQKRIKTR